MIINGNYKWFDIESLKPLFIEASVKVYGEDYRESITNKINSFKYHPYHSIEYVTDYYNAYIYSFREEIAEEFFKLSGIEPDEKLKKIIIPEEYDKYPALFYAVEGGLNVDSTNYTSEGVNYLKQIRDIIIDRFGLTGSDEDIYKQLLVLRNIYAQAEEIVEGRHKCDVTEDMNILSCNAINIVKRYLKIAKDAGYDVSFEDIYKLGNDNFNVSDIYNLKCARTLFGGDVKTPGLIKSFTSESNERLKNAPDFEQLSIIVDRLKYLDTIGLPFKFINKEELYEATDQDNYVNRILQEYEYQKTCPNQIKFIDYWNYDEKELKKAFKTGQFFPEDLADTLEEDRIEICEDLVQGCKFYSKRDPYPYFTEFLNFVTYNNEDLDIMKPYADLYILEDYVITQDRFIDNIAHELNHILGCGFPLILNPKTNVVTSKNGVNFRRNEIDENNKIIYASQDYNCAFNMTNDPVMQRLEEYINEQQAKEIAEQIKILMEEQGISLGLDEDTVLEHNPFDYACLYDFYDFLGRDFYEKFYQELKLQKIDDSYNMYFKDTFGIDIESHKMLDLMVYLRGKIKRLQQDPMYLEEGVVDYQKVHKLAELIDKFHIEIYPYIERKYLEDGYINFDKLDPRIKKQINKLIAKKDKIMGAMISDELEEQPPISFMMIKE